MNDILFHDDGNNDLPKGIGLRKKVAGTMAEADFKKKVMVRTRYVMTDFDDHKKQKNGGGGCTSYRGHALQNKY